MYVAWIIVLIIKYTYVVASKSHVSSQCWWVANIFFSYFLNQARACFLEIAFVHDVGMCACVRVCVCPWGYKLHSRDIESVQLAEQVCCI